MLRLAAVMAWLGGLGFALLPLEFAFWIGLVLPFGPIVGMTRTALALAAWPTREQSALTQP